MTTHELHELQLILRRLVSRNETLLAHCEDSDHHRISDPVVQHRLLFDDLEVLSKWWRDVKNGAKTLT